MKLVNFNIQTFFFFLQVPLLGLIVNNDFSTNTFIKKLINNHNNTVLRTIRMGLLLGHRGNIFSKNVQQNQNIILFPDQVLKMSNIR